MKPCPICGTRTGIHGFSWEYDRKIREQAENDSITDSLPPPID